MNITFVGSSHGVPEANRRCTCIMVNVGENVYFVDMGTSAVDALRKRGVSMDDVKGVFITHMHGDHTNGLIQFIDLITWYFKTPDPVVCLPVMEAAEVIDKWLKVCFNDGHKDIRYRKTEAGVVFDDGVLKVTAIPTQHCPHSFAYLLEAEGKAVLYTGDLKHPTVDFPMVDKPLDLFIGESAHFAATEYLPLWEKMDVKKICITHYSPRFMPTVLECGKALAEKGLPFVLATDDLELKV